MNPRLPGWSGLRVWIIGASTGIGAETADLLLQRGAKVALSARSSERLERVAAGRADAVIAPLDITDHASVARAHAAISQTWGAIDLTLIVAGTHADMRAQNFDLAQAQALIDINVSGVLHCVAAVLPGLIAGRGYRGIGIVSSVAGYSGLPRALVYGASKAALINFCESLYIDLHDAGIGVYLINPGFVDTPLTKKNDFPMPALMSATDAAKALLDGIERRQFDIHFPKRFTRWLKLLRLLPYRLYFPLIKRITGL